MTNQSLLQSTSVWDLRNKVQEKLQRLTKTSMQSLARTGPALASIHSHSSAQSPPLFGLRVGEISAVNLIERRRRTRES